MIPQNFTQKSTAKTRMCGVTVYGDHLGNFTQAAQWSHFSQMESTKPCGIALARFWCQIVRCAPRAKEESHWGAQLFYPQIFGRAGRTWSEVRAPAFKRTNMKRNYLQVVNLTPARDIDREFRTVIFPMRTE